MNIIDFFNDNCMDVPYHWNGRYNEYSALLEEIFSQYQNNINELGDDEFSKKISENSTIIAENCNDIQQIVEKYLDGDLFKAYNIFQKLIKKKRRIN